MVFKLQTFKDPIYFAFYMQIMCKALHYNGPSTAKIERIYFVLRIMLTLNAQDLPTLASVAKSHTVSVLLAPPTLLILCS
jgi:hypothetical protein